MLMSQAIFLDSEFFNEFVKHSIVDANRIIKLVTNSNDNCLILLLEAIGESEELLNGETKSVEEKAIEQKVKKNESLILNVHHIEGISIASKKKEMDTRTVESAECKKKPIEIVIPDEQKLPEVKNTSSSKATQNNEIGKETLAEESNTVEQSIPNNNSVQTNQEYASTQVNTAVNKFDKDEVTRESKISNLARFRDPMRVRLQRLSRFTTRSKMLDTRNLSNSPLYGNCYLKSSKSSNYPKFYNPNVPNVKLVL